MVTLIACVLAFALPIVAEAETVSSATVNSAIDAQLDAAAKGAHVEGQQQDIRVVVARIINVSLSLLGIILVALLVYAGYLWMTAAGEEEPITKAKSIIRNAIIGLIIIMLAYAITQFVLTRLLSAAVR